MVFFSDVIPSVSQTERPVKAVLSPKSGSRAAAGAARFAGVVLMLAAVGIWILNGPLWDAEMMLVRLAASVLFMCAGLGLLHVGRSHPQGEIHLDTRTRELRHIQRGSDGIARVQQRFVLANLGDIIIEDDLMVLHDKSGDIVMELSDLPRDSLQIIRRALQNM